jgi:hypothetical protein
VHAAVEVEGDIDGRAERVTDGGDPGDDRVEPLGPVEKIEFGGRVHLHRGEALRDPGLDLADEVGGPVAADPGVYAHAVPHGTAEELVHGQAMPASLDVPERLLDRRGGRGEHRPVAEETAAPHPLPQILDPARVGSGDIAGEVADRAGDRGVPPGHDGLAPARQPVVRADPDEDPARRDPVRGDRGDARHQR